MSRNAENSIEKEVTTSIQVEAKPEKIMSSLAINPDKKISVAKYLQIKPQSSNVSALLKKLYGKEFHTESEWDEIVEKLLATKIK